MLENQKRKSSLAFGYARGSPDFTAFIFAFCLHALGETF